LRTRGNGWLQANPAWADCSEQLLNDAGPDFVDPPGPAGSHYITRRREPTDPAEMRNGAQYLGDVAARSDGIKFLSWPIAAGGLPRI
jgi:hypothetical protein